VEVERTWVEIACPDLENSIEKASQVIIYGHATDLSISQSVSPGLPEVEDEIGQK
jgi:hypothetical protein